MVRFGPRRAFMAGQDSLPTDALPTLFPSSGNLKESSNADHHHHHPLDLFLF